MSRADRIRGAVPERHYTEAELDALEIDANRAMIADEREGELMPLPATCPRGCGRKVFAVRDEHGHPCTVERDDRYGTLIAVAPFGVGTVVVEGDAGRDDPSYRWHTNGVLKGRVAIMRNVCGRSLEEAIAVAFGSDDGGAAFGRGER